VTITGSAIVTVDQLSGEPGLRTRRVARSRRGAVDRTAPQLRVVLLGGFRVQRADALRPVSDWQLRTAKTLTKLLASSTEHALHREQILDLLWPGVDGASALNSFGKALHAARRAFEPELLPRQSSAYLRLTDSMLALDSEHVAVDVYVTRRRRAEQRLHR
jgi:DNA-binding SARP family transcriptional activator